MQHRVRLCVGREGEKQRDCQQEKTRETGTHPPRHELHFSPPSLRCWYSSPRRSDRGLVCGESPRAPRERAVAAPEDPPAGVARPEDRKVRLAVPVVVARHRDVSALAPGAPLKGPIAAPEDPPAGVA